MKSMLVYCTVLLAALFIMGCQTSAGFQAGAAALGPRIASVANAYVNADATLDAPTKAARLAQASTLATDTASASSIARSAVTTDWNAIKPWLTAYIAADTKLDPDERALRVGLGTEMDKLIADDGARPLSGSALTVPSTAPTK